MACTIDEVIELLMERNLDLRAKFLEIPQMRADVLTASLCVQLDFLRRQPASALWFRLGPEARRADAV